MVVVDGQTYNSADEAWDLGSLECVEERSGNVRYYNAVDDGDDDYILQHAPHYVGGGSRIWCLDSGSVWIFHRKSDTWYKIG